MMAKDPRIAAGRSGLFENAVFTEKLMTLLLPLSRVIALILLSLLISTLNPNFLKVTNLINILRQAAPQVIVALGMTLVLLTGGIDLSVGSTMTLASVVAGHYLTQTAGLPWPIAAAAGLATGVAMGLVNGLMIARIKMPSAIATYGMLWIGRGVSFAIMGPSPYFGFADGFRQFGRGMWFELPVPIWIMTFAAAVIFFLLKWTTFGRRVYAVGSNIDAARASGIKSDRILLWVYVLSGFLAAVAGLLLTARLNAVDQDIGEPFLLPAIASPVIGGTSMAGGEGSVGGSIIGSLLMVVLLNGMNLLKIPSLWQQLALGLVMLVAVWLDVRIKRRNG